MSFVLDNSIALAWCFEDEQPEHVMNLLDRVTETGAFAPSLWPLEALNGLLIAERRRRIDAGLRRRFADFLRELPVTIDTETADLAWTATVELAERLRLSLYDASYLERYAANCRSLPWTRSSSTLQKHQARSYSEPENYPPPHRLPARGRG
jgi:predicted nucleic acid-binding protein